MNEKDFVSKKFKRESKNAPAIVWGKEFLAKSQKEQIEYLKKLASSLNHSADRLQKERNDLSDMLFQKEDQLVKLKIDRQAEQKMIQSQLEKENEAKAKLLEENKGLYAEIKDLERKINAH